MSVLELTDEQVLSLIGQLPSAKKREALLALARDAGARREERMAHAEAQLRQRARERGLDWETLDDAGREARLARFFRPYHAALADLLDAAPPQLILSLHSFTPRLASDPGQARPWQVGVLYNQDDRAARIAIPLLAAQGLIVGDQEPYSGKLLTATMNRHAEAEGRPYLGIEIRQDEIASAEGQAIWAERLHDLCNRVALAIGG